MTRTSKTITLTTGGVENEYARVPERIKLFREDCPNGKITTDFELKENDVVVFTARVVKDKAKPESAESMGHSMGKAGGNKAFEKLETIAVGRALALLGYLASGEIASSEEMEEFLDFRLKKIADAVTALKKAKTIPQLRKTFMGLGDLMSEKQIIEAKDTQKQKLTLQVKPPVVVKGEPKQ
jgi:hypothetical protein